MPEIIGEIKKNSTEKIVISLNEYKGHKYIDVRIHYLNFKDDTYKPTKKGITISSDKVKPVMEMILEAAEKL
tara:strand:- start:54 stop:269 length:216 start_codon:yes stop_codon:yes gene_type:complete